MIFFPHFFLFRFRVFFCVCVGNECLKESFNQNDSSRNICLLMRRRLRRVKTRKLEVFRKLFQLNFSSSYLKHLLRKKLKEVSKEEKASTSDLRIIAQKFILISFLNLRFYPFFSVSSISVEKQRNFDNKHLKVIFCRSGKETIFIRRKAFDFISTKKLYFLHSTIFEHLEKSHNDEDDFQKQEKRFCSPYKKTLLLKKIQNSNKKVYLLEF